MNINSFFLDKLTAGSQTLTSGSEKSSLSSFLFSDIMKVYELEKGAEVKSEVGCENPVLNTLEGLPFTDSVVECNDLKLRTLSDFIKSFIGSSQEPVNISESKKDLQPIVISKKKFLLSSGGMENFLKGLVESINLNFSDDLKTTVVENKETKEESKELNIVLKTDEKEITPLEKKLDEKIDENSPLSAPVTILESIFNFLSENKSLSFSFKSNLERVSINFFELPEDNFETKINLVRLASDFNKDGKKIFNSEFESSNEIEKGETFNPLSTSSTENKSAEYFISSSEKIDLLLGKSSGRVSNKEKLLNPVDLNTSQKENIYKTEIVEVTYKPGSLLNDLKEEAISKSGKVLLDPVILSAFASNHPEVSEVQFRLSNNLSMQLSIDTSTEQKILGSTVYGQSETPNLNYLFIQNISSEHQGTNIEIDNKSTIETKGKKISETTITPDSKSIPVKMELPLSSDLLKGEVVADISPDQAVAVKSNVKEQVTAKSVSSNEALENSVDSKNNVKLTGIENTKSILLNTDQQGSNIKTGFNKNINDQTVAKRSVEFSGTKGNYESIKIIDKEMTVKLVSNDAAKTSKVDVKDAVNKIFAEIEFEKNKPIEKANNPVQEAEYTFGDSELKDQKEFNSLSNRKLSGVEFKKTVGKNENVKNIEESESIKSIPSNLSKESKVIDNKAVNESSVEKDFMNSKPGDSFKEIYHRAEQIADANEINNKKALFSELSSISGGSDVKKAANKEDSTKNIKDEANLKSASDENVKEKIVKETENKSSDGKDFAKHKSEDSFKSTLQNAERVSGNESEKFKIAPELKTSLEIPKTIKTHEIIPEFTKIIQTGEKQSITFQLTPENLGKIKLIVELVENQINTRIEVENEQVKQFVQSNVEQLKQNLQSSGIQLSSVNISLTESEQKFSKGFSPRKKPGEKVNKVKVGDEKPAPAQKSLGYNTYEFLA